MNLKTINPHDAQDEIEVDERKFSMESIILLLVVGIYFLLQIYVLPKMGIST